MQVSILRCQVVEDDARVIRRAIIDSNDLKSLQGLLRKYGFDALCNIFFSVIARHDKRNVNLWILRPSGTIRYGCVNKRRTKLALHHRKTQCATRGIARPDGITTKHRVNSRRRGASDHALHLHDVLLHLSSFLIDCPRRRIPSRKRLYQVHQETMNEKCTNYRHYRGPEIVKNP